VCARVQLTGNGGRGNIIILVLAESGHKNIGFQWELAESPIARARESARMKSSRSLVVELFLIRGAPSILR